MPRFLPHHSPRSFGVFFDEGCLSVRFRFRSDFFFGSKLEPSCNFRHRVLKLNEEEEEEEESNKR